MNLVNECRCSNPKKKKKKKNYKTSKAEVFEDKTNTNEILPLVLPYNETTMDKELEVLLKLGLFALLQITVLN